MENSLITHKSKNVVWYELGSNPACKAVTRHFCADGDGIVTVEEINGFFNLYDQGEHIKKLGRDLPVALQVGEHYLHANYREIYNCCKN